jgi:hypothetical protein
MKSKIIQKPSQKSWMDIWKWIQHSPNFDDSSWLVITFVSSEKMWRLLPSCYVLLYTTETYVRWHSGQRVLYAPGANRGSFTHTHTQRTGGLNRLCTKNAGSSPFTKIQKVYQGF